MKKLKIAIPVTLACLVVISILFGMTNSYLTDIESKYNIITIGNVKLKIEEPKYEDSQTFAAGDTIVKDPVITNTGTEDEYVFFSIAVPKRAVTLLYEEDTKIGETTYKEGTPTANNLDNGEIKKQLDEIYRLIATGENSANVVAELDTDTEKPNEKPQLDFSYNQGKNGVEGWIYLDRAVNKEQDGITYDYYCFGYNRRLLYNSDQTVKDQTVSLFDKIQLKSFIDEEVNGTPTTKATEVADIIVKAYGIQANSLGIEGVDDLSRDAFLTKDDLTKILKIIKGKTG